MRVLKYIPLITAMTMVPFASIWAQEETVVDGEGFNRSVDVVNTYQPTLRRAKKISENPTLDDTATYTNEKFTYEVLNRIAKVTTKPEVLAPSSMSFPAYESPYSALIEGAVGYSPAVYGQVTYNMSNSRRYHLSVNAGHISQFGKVKMENDQKNEAQQHDTWAGLTFNRFNKNVAFNCNLKFLTSGYKYYGLNTINDELQYLTEDGIEVSGADLTYLDKQRNTTIDLNMEVGNRLVNPREKFSFAARGGFGFMANKAGVNHTNFNLGGNLCFPLSKSSSSIDALISVEHFKTHLGDSSLIYNFIERSGTDVKIFPHFILEYDFMKLNLGLRLIAVVGDDTNKDDFIVQPDLNLDFFIGDGSVRFYAGLSGDYNQNNFRTLMEQNRYLSPDLKFYIWDKREEAYVLREGIRPTQSPILFKLGVRTSFSKMLQLHLGLDFQSLGDEVFFVNRNFQTIVGTDTINAHNQQFALLQDDGKLFRLHGEINVNPTENSNVRFSATLMKYNMDYVEEPWYKPTFKLGLYGSFKPVERLKVRASFDLEGKRKAYNPTLREAEELDAVMDLNIGAHYYISNRWTAFVDFSNITANDQKRWLGYSSHRFNALLGVTYKF